MGEFHTLDGYNRREQRAITRTMEDYLEMICRMSETDPIVRVQNLADELNVSPSSVTKMMQQLAARGFAEYKPYAYLKLTPLGESEGAYLLHRHAVLHAFLCFVNQTNDELEQVELIEHFFDRRTVENIDRMLQAIEKQN